MVSRQKNSDATRPRRSPARTDEEREMRLVAQAYDLAERQLEEGTISATVHSQLLKSGSRREKFELRKLEMEVELRRAQIDQMQSQRSSEELYAKAMDAMRRYSGQEVVEDEV